MSFVTDHIRKIDSQIDSFQSVARSASSREQEPLDELQDTTQSSDSDDSHEIDTPRALQLQQAIKSISSASASRSLLYPSFILTALKQADILEYASDAHTSQPAKGTDWEQELEWLLVSKATTQVYGLVLKRLLDQTIPLSNDIGYWDEVLGSTRYAALYTVQTSPLRLWNWTTSIYHDARHRLKAVDRSVHEDSSQIRPLSDHWKQFYNLVRASIRDHSLADVQSRLMSPINISQLEVRSKRRHLRKLREMSGSGLGILVDEGMMLDANDEDSVTSKARSDDKDEWKSVVWKSVSLMEAVLRNITALELGPGEFEESVFLKIDEEHASAPSSTGEDQMPPQARHLAMRLQQLLDVHLPHHIDASNMATIRYGRPSRLVRYWLPGTVLLLSSSTIFRVVLNRKAEIVTWIRDFGSTTLDFWYNWVVEPVKKVVGTIRHDKDSEIAIMSKESLQGDRASLERMVVDFAKDNPEGGSSLSDAQLADVRAKVKEGDLTPVLRAYEKDLRKPFIGTVRGDLIRALLIQVQKTKVDVEVAVGGIDNLLKSQELVFGFVGLTPGILVIIGLSQWLSGVFAGRKGRVQGRRQGSMLRILRNIDRILTASNPTNSNGMLSYKEHGMLLCEVHVLRERATKSLPGDIKNEFLEEIHDLIDLRTGVERQLRVVERIRWAYSKYLH